ncbi:hypothetical protein OpiT1DRAFT_00013 [Opitutaceae bacterium TAV1]|nr:hypothetical protein OpiT1DRAFT_00013 [Opitutaceae bacterium TAV1]
MCQRRVADHIRRHRHQGKHDSLERLAEEGIALPPATDATGMAGPGLDRDEQDAFRVALLGTLLAELRNGISPRMFMIFELVKLAGNPPADVAIRLGVKRGVVDNSVYKAMQKLREIAARKTLTEEYPQ